MIGFDSLASLATKLADMNRADIRRGIARVPKLRAERLVAWSRRVAQTWASLFRRRGHLLPTHTRSRDRAVHAAKL
jgi:hypothetical protein